MGHARDPAPVVEEVWPKADETPSRRAVRDAEVRPDPRFGRRPIKLSAHSAYPAGVREDRVGSDRPSVGRSLRRAFFRFLFAVLVGVSGTLGWQSYGEQIIAAHAPTLAWLFSISAPKVPEMAATSGSAQVAPVASNLEAVRRSLEQLATKQEQMAEDIAALQAIEDDMRQKMSFMPPSPTSVPPAISVMQPRLPQPKVQSSATPSSPEFRPPLPSGPAASAR
jgi:hypothetical protein